MNIFGEKCMAYQINIEASIQNLFQAQVFCFLLKKNKLYPLVLSNLFQIYEPKMVEGLKFYFSISLE